MQQSINKRIKNVIRHYFPHCEKIIHMSPLPKGYGNRRSYLGKRVWKVCLGSPYDREEVVVKEVDNKMTEERISLQSGLMEHLEHYGMKSLFPRYFKLKNKNHILQIDQFKIVCQKFIQGNRIRAGEFTSDLRKKSAQFLAHFHKISSAYIPTNYNHYQNKILELKSFPYNTSQIIKKYKIKNCDMLRNYFNEYFKGFKWKNEYEDIRKFSRKYFQPFKNKIAEYKKHLYNTYGTTLPETFLYIIEEWLHYNFQKYCADMQGLNHKQFIEVFIHGDFSPNNILIDSSEKNICGLVDFNDAQKEIRLLDFVEIFNRLDDILPDFTEKKVVEFLNAYYRECIRLKWVPLTDTEIRAFYNILRLLICTRLRMLRNYYIRENTQKRRNKYEWISISNLERLIWLDGKIDTMNMDAFVKKIIH